MSYLNVSVCIQEKKGRQLLYSFFLCKSGLLCFMMNGILTLVHSDCFNFGLGVPRRQKIKTGISGKRTVRYISAVYQLIPELIKWTGGSGA